MDFRCVWATVIGIPWHVWFVIKIGIKIEFEYYKRAGIGSQIEIL